MSTYEDLLAEKIQKDKDDCIEKIEDALETIRVIHKNDNESASSKRMRYFPRLSRIMDIIKEYYPTEDILDELDTDDMFYHIKQHNCWELDNYVEDELSDQENKLRAEFEEELDAIDTDVCHKIEDMTPDEWWETVARVFGICSPMDSERMKTGIAKMMEKLNKSNYQTEWRRIAAAFYRKCKDYDKENKDDREEV